MANVTITLDDETLRRARIRALESGTSLNAMIRDYLERLVGADPTREAGERLAQLAEAAHGSSGSAGRAWRQADVYER